MEKRTCNCDYCNKPIFGKYYKQVAYEDPICDYCAKFVCYQCFCCGHYFYLEPNEEKEVGLCEGCASELMKCCETCGKYVMTQRAQYINGGYYCNLCAFDAAFGIDNNEE